MNLKIGFIGVGNIAQAHIQALRKMDGVEISCLYDINPDLARNVAASLGAKVMDSADQVLDANLIDAAYICIPQFAREQLDVMAARRGIPFLVEKPLGLNIKEVRQKGRIISDSGVIHSVGYCLRYLDTVQIAKAYLADRKIHLIQASRFGKMYAVPWWLQIEKSGGHLVDAVTHQVDMIRFIAGNFQQVQANFGRLSMEQVRPEATIYDSGVISFIMENGTIGNLTETCLSMYHSSQDIKVFGPDFFVQLSENGTIVTIVDEKQNITQTSVNDFYYEQSKAFIEAVREGSQSLILSNYNDGTESLAFTLGANRSAKERVVVSLD